MTNASSMHEAGHSKPVLWDNPEGWGGEEGLKPQLLLYQPNTFKSITYYEIHKLREYIKVKRINPKCSLHKKTMFYFFNLIFFHMRWWSSTKLIVIIISWYMSVKTLCCTP